MNKFQQYLSYLNEQIQLTHLEHIEDLIIIDGIKGAKDAILFLRDNLKILQGHGNAEVFRKIDGSPSLVAGINPENGKFFVATKSLFNKEPKVNYTEADIDANHASGVKDTLKIALNELSKLGIKNIIQGDVLFTKNILQTTTIDDMKYVTFTPNTITYAVPYDSDLAKQILKAEIGVAWHTSYTGSTIESLSASFKIDISSHKKVTTVYDTTTKLTVANIMFSPAEYEMALGITNELESEMSKFNSDDFDFIQANKIDIMAYINSKVRQGETVSNSMVKGLFDYIEVKFNKEKDKLKTDKSKDAKENQKKEMFKELRAVAGTLWYVLLFHQRVQDVKNIIVKKLDEIKTIDTFIETSDGYKATSPEGYVVVDLLKGGAVKLVDRLEFSKNNFNAMSGWRK